MSVDAPWSDELRPRRSISFYGSDWLGDARLRGCSFAARGIWMDLIASMSSTAPGFAIISGQGPSTVRQIAKMLGSNGNQVRALLRELFDARVYTLLPPGTSLEALIDTPRVIEGVDGEVTDPIAAIDAGWVIVSRRLLRDTAKSAKNKENGRKGGNPTLGRSDKRPAAKRITEPLKPHTYPTPSLESLPPFRGETEGGVKKSATNGARERASSPHESADAHDRAPEMKLQAPPRPDAIQSGDIRKVIPDLRRETPRGRTDAEKERDHQFNVEALRKAAAAEKTSPEEPRQQQQRSAVR